MQLKPEEISKVIRSQIKYYENTIQQNETGTILMVGDGIARASGLINCMAGELLEFEDGKPDAYVYCITDEGCHLTYHRFTKDDYEAFGF